MVIGGSRSPVNNQARPAQPSVHCLPFIPVVAK
jgi:hypothetical protein